MRPRQSHARPQQPALIAGERGCLPAVPQMPGDRLEDAGGYFGHVGAGGHWLPPLCPW